MKILLKYKYLFLLNILISCSINKKVNTDTNHHELNESIDKISGKINCTKEKNIFNFNEKLITLDFSIDFCEVFQQELSKNQNIAINIILTRKDDYEPSMMFYQIYDNNKVIEKRTINFHSRPFGMDYESYKHSISYKIENLKLSFKNENFENELKDKISLTLLIE